MDRTRKEKRCPRSQELMAKVMSSASTVVVYLYHAFGLLVLVCASVGGVSI